MLRVLRAGAVSAALVLGPAGCSLLAPTETSVESSQSPSPAAPVAEPPIPATEVLLAGSAGTMSWRVRIPVFSTASAADAINRRVRAAAQSAISSAKAESREDAGAKRRLTGQNVITTNDARTVQVVLTFTDNLEGTAHPAYAVTTLALRAADGSPITLRQIFPDEKAALATVAAEVKRIAKAKDEEVVEEDGLQPREANFAAWQTTIFGLELHFQDYQLGGHGLRSYTVAWPKVRSLMSPEARTLLDPVH